MLRNCLRAAMALVPVLAAGAPLALLHPAGATPPPTITPMLFTDPANNTCPDDAGCSLRGAVLKANGVAGTTIQLLAGTYHLTINQGQGADDGSTGDLDISINTTIQGAGAGQTIVQADVAVSGAPFNDRIFEADNSSNQENVTISDLTVTGGHPLNAQGTEPDGGGILNDGDILTVHNVIIENNVTAAGPQLSAGGNGGGLASNNGVLSVTNSTVRNNHAAGSGGGISNTHSSSGADTFTNLLVSGNTSDGFFNAPDSGGGGIYNDVGRSAFATFTDVMVTGNHATAMNGGGIYEGSDGPATLRYDNVTLSNNDALFLGGGFYDGAGTPVITNSTIDGNRITGNVDDSGPKDGGGLAIGAPTGLVTLNNATISGNHAPLGTGGGLYLNQGEHLVLHNTLVVGNTGTGGTVQNCNTSNGTTTSQGHNLANDGTCSLTGTADRQGSQYDPQLVALAGNQGPQDGAPTATSPTLTRALPAGSIAINTADNTNCPKIDEQHVTRPQQAVCDVGAYEFVAAAQASPVATPSLPKAGAVGGRVDYTALVFALAVVALAGVPVLVRARRS